MSFSPCCSIGDYQLLGKIGEGGLGKVFLARKKLNSDGELFAMKFGSKANISIYLHLLGWVKQEREVSIKQVLTFSLLKTQT